MYKYVVNIILFIALDMMANVKIANSLELRQGTMQNSLLNNSAQIQRQVKMPMPAPMPNSSYSLPPSNHNFQPQLTNPARSNIQPNSGYTSSHRAWCENRYGNYRFMDNSFKDHGGMRQNCISPYSK